MLKEEEWDSITNSTLFCALIIFLAAIPYCILLQHHNQQIRRRTSMPFGSPNRRGKSPPRAPPSSPMHAQYRRQHEPLPQERIADLLQFAQSSYQTNPTDALGALMNALTISTGNSAASDHALGRIREELGDVVADCVAGNVGNNIGAGSSSYRRENNNMQQQQYQQQNSPHFSNTSSHNNMSEREITIRAMAVVEGLLKDESTILYAQGKSHILQQAMEDGSSVVCTKCGDMISRERWQQHAEYWCRAITDEKSCDGTNGDMKMDE